MDGDAAVEDGAAAFVGQAAPGQLAARIAGLVFDAQTRVEVAAAVGQQQAAGDHRGALALQRDVELVARQAGAQLQVHAAVFGARGQHGVGAREQAGARAVVLHAGVHEPRAAGQVHVHQVVGEVAMLALREMVLDHGERSVLAHARSGGAGAARDRRRRRRRRTPGAPAPPPRRRPPRAAARRRWPARR